MKEERISERMLTQDKLISLMLDGLRRISVWQEGAQELLLELKENVNRPEEFKIISLQNEIHIQGTDIRGLAYGIQSLSELLLKKSADKSGIPEEILLEGSPKVRIRGVDKFIMNSDDEEWWMNASYWEAYIRRLAESRINRLCLVTGFDTEYFSPPYAFLTEIEGYEKVSVLMRHKREEYLLALRMVGRICHEYHLEFSFAVWQQQPWESGAQKMVFGLEKQDELCDYCCLGIQKLLKGCPEIDVIHFRVNHESGVGDERSAEDYWLRQIDAVGEVNRNVRPVRLELRAKGMTDSMVERAIQAGLEVSVSTKYCCEHAGLPHHLTRMRTQELERLSNLNMARRYSYADLLRKPRKYRMIYRLWCNGSTDLFLWGDPDYVRKFVRSMEVGDADGFEVIPPLTLKGGREFDRHTGWRLFDDPAYQPEGWEDERYWLFYTLYGRIGYQSDCDEIAWEREMRGRLQERAGLAMELVKTFSKVIPFITGFHFPEHPQLWYWPEMNTGAALFPENNYHPDFKKEGDTYQDALPCEEGLFYSIADYVRADGKTDGRYTPWQVYEWLTALEEKLEELLGQAEGTEGNREWKCIVLDAGMLQSLTGFHRNKLKAALGLSRFLYQKDASFLSAAAEDMHQALEAWNRLSALGLHYHSNLLFGAGVNCHRRGSWKDYLPEVERDAAMLDELALQYGNGKRKKLFHRVRKENPRMRDDLPAAHTAGKDLEVVLTCSEELPVFMRYRHTNQLEGEFERMPMKRTQDGYTCTLAGEYLTPQWDLMIYFEAADRNGDGIIYPGIDSRDIEMPYRLIHII